jgi:hypothetical protein
MQSNLINFLLNNKVKLDSYQDEPSDLVGLACVVWDEDFMYTVETISHVRANSPYPYVTINRLAYRFALPCP